MKSFRLLVFLSIVTGTRAFCVSADPNSVRPFEEIRNQKNPQADLKLIEASRNLDVDGVRNALKAGANPNYKAKFGKFGNIDKSAIGYLVEFGLVGKIRYLVEFGLFGKGKKREQDALDILRLLFEAGAKEQECDCHVIYFLAYENLPSLIDLLVTNGFDPNGTCWDMLTPMEVAEQEGNKEVVSVLLKNGVKLLSDETISHLRFIGYAQDCNIVDMHKNLTDSAFVNKPDKDGKTALTEVVSDLRIGVNWYAGISYLLQKGADPNLQGRHFLGSALHIAMRNTMSAPDEAGEVFGLLGIEALLKAGADVSSQNKDAQTPLHIASKYDNLKGAILLIEAGAKVMEKDNSGRMPLDYAKSPEMIALLKSVSAKEQ